MRVPTQAPPRKVECIGRAHRAPDRALHARQAVDSAGAPLDAASRRTMEAGFGHDFSRIRVHADAAAAESARAIHAHAYTVGSHLFFGQGRYAPGTSAGRQLLAHELTHAVQADRHGAAAGAAPAVSDPSGPAEREAASVAGRVGRGAPAGPVTAAPTASLHRAFFSFLTQFGTFDERELQDYLTFIDKGRIEGAADSDNKAVQVVQAWRNGGSPYELDNTRRAVIIKELLDGPTTADDEEAIVEILERSDPAMLDRIFFAFGGPSQVQITEDVPDDEDSPLADFCRRRWVGGIEAFRKDQGEPRAAGVAIPLGQPLPTPQPGLPLEMPLPTKTHTVPRPGLFEGGEPPPETRKGEPSAGPEPFPGANGPYPAVWQDAFRVALASPAGKAFKDAIKPILLADWKSLSTAEQVGLILSQALPGSIIAYGFARMSEAQRQAFSDVFATPPDVAARRPLEAATWGTVNVDVDPDLAPRKVRTSLFDVDVPQKRPAGGTGLGADLKIDKPWTKTFFKPGEALRVVYTTPDRGWTVDIVVITDKDESKVVDTQKLTEARTDVAITLFAPEKAGIYGVRLVDSDGTVRRMIRFKVIAETR